MVGRWIIYFYECEKQVKIFLKKKPQNSLSHEWNKFLTQRQKQWFFSIHSFYLILHYMQYMKWCHNRLLFLHCENE